MSGYIYTGSTPSKSADSTDWQMLGGLIGGGVFLLTILAGLIIIFRYKPPDPEPGLPGNDIYIYTTLRGRIKGNCRAIYLILPSAEGNIKYIALSRGQYSDIAREGGF